MTVLTVFCLALFPKININEDMTRYLPNDSRMRQGLDSLRTNFPEIDMNAYFVKVMFSGVEDKDSLADSLTDIEGVAGISAISGKDGFVLYQLSIEEGADTKAVASRISEAYGESAVVEHNANSIMPDNMVLILVVGALIVFGILFLMCPSFVEALLFIVTIGMAVILNIGTNALLPSVSMMTNTIVAVLQLVLSMDYSIILMNRFRQILKDQSDIDQAMSLALRSASPSILSSGFTTIVGLLALLFMKFKIGTDLGLVLAKGVVFSLISIYTILPALILLFYDGIRKSEKKVFLIPTDPLARFEHRFRIPLAIIFIIIFGFSRYLSGKTELSYASIWESRINEVFPPVNTFSLLYRTSVEDKIIAVNDSLVSDDNVLMALSYPALFKKELTAEEMCDNVSALLAALPEMPGADIPDLSYVKGILTPQMLRILYYAASHSPGDEKMSFEDMIHLGEEASQSGLLPEGMDVEALVAQFMATPEPIMEPAPVAAVIPAAADAKQLQTDTLRTPDASALAETTQTQEALAEASASDDPEAKDHLSLAQIARPEVDESGDDPYGLQGKYHFTKEKLNTPMNSTELADYLGFSKSQASAAYTMARKRNGTMTPDEFIDYMIEKVLNNKLLRKMISDKQAQGLHYIRKEMDAILAMPETSPAPAISPVASVPADTVSIEALPADSASIAPPACADGNADASALAKAVPSDISTPVETELPSKVEMTPMERLAQMYASGDKYSSTQIYNSLHNAGIDILDKGTVDLMFIYYGSRHNYDDSTRMSLGGIIDFLSEEVAVNDSYAVFLDDSTRTMLGGMDKMLENGLKMLRKDDWSMAAIVTDYPLESDETFEFVEKISSVCDGELGRQNSCLIGESVMYKEMKDGFRQELLLLTLLTVISIFLIVALSFRSVLIPAILVLTVLTGVNVNVFFSGVGGHTMLYMAYLIVQSILIGATIDYGILFTNYYLSCRRSGQPVSVALRQAYRGSIHTVMTSGLIIVLAPFIMAKLLTDPTICSILSSLTFGALSVILLIIFILPALLAASDKLIVRIRQNGENRE